MDEATRDPRIQALRRAGVWLLAATALLAAALATRRPTRLEVYSSGGRVDVTVAGTELSAPVAIAAVDTIEIVAMDSVDPPGGRSLEVEQDGRPLVQDHLPRRFTIPGRGLRPLGDWELDEHAARGVVYRREVHLGGDFVLRATFSGRFHHDLDVVLAGRPTVTVALRRGLINNDVSLRVGDGGPVASTSIDPVPWSDLASTMSVLAGGAAAAALLIALFAIVAGIVPSADRELLEPGTSGAAPYTAVAALAAVAAVSLSAWFARGVLEGLPHMPDSVTYLLQSRWLLHGRLYQDAVAIQSHLDVPFTYVVGGRWLAQYPFGWPALLAVGTAIGLPWLVAPLLAGAYTVLLYLIGRELYSPAIGAMAVVLTVVSPLGRELFGSMFAHAAAATLLLLSLWLLLVARRRGWIGVGAASGVALGLAFGVRPLSALAVAAPIAVFALVDGAGARDPRDRLAVPLAAMAGAALAAVPTLLANLAITGSPFRFGYAFARGTMYGLANLPFGLRNLDALLASTAPALYGWGWGVGHGWLLVALPLAFAWIPFLRRRATTADWMLAGCVAALALSFVGARAHGLHGYGPRYYFEAFFALYLLTARGFQELARMGAPRAGPARRPVVLLAATLFVLLNCSALVVLPARLSLYRGYNHVNGSLERQVRALDSDRALVIFSTPRWYNWAMAARLMGGDAAHAPAFATRRGSVLPLLRFFPDRPVYLWHDNRLTPYRRHPPGAPRRATTGEHDPDDG